MSKFFDHAEKSSLPWKEDVFQIGLVRSHEDIFGRPKGLTPEVGLISQSQNSNENKVVDRSS
jgi:hypothetical protein